MRRVVADTIAAVGDDGEAGWTGLFTLYGCRFCLAGESKVYVPMLNVSSGAVMKKAVIGLTGVLGAGGVPVESRAVSVEPAGRGLGLSVVRDASPPGFRTSGSERDGAVLYRSAGVVLVIDTLRRRSTLTASVGAGEILSSEAAAWLGRAADSGSAGDNGLRAGVVCVR